jgi:CheY-like chemotaxis protein
MNGFSDVHVLVVDDDLEQLAHLQSLLRDLGCRVDVAADGAKAVREGRRLDPDVIFMDLGMPVLNGWDAIREIRRERGARVYIIAVSAYEDADSRQRAFAAGCDEYIIKPLDVCGAVRAYVYRKRGVQSVDSG